MSSKPYFQLGARIMGVEASLDIDNSKAWEQDESTQMVCLLQANYSRV